MVVLRRFGWLALAVALLCGCAQGPSLVGRWKGTFNGFPATVEFKPDDTFTAHTAMKRGGLEAQGDFNGTYELQGETLTVTQKAVDIKGLAEPLETMAKGYVEKENNRPHTGKVTFKTNDEVEIANDEGVYTLRRQR